MAAPSRDHDPQREVAAASSAAKSTASSPVCPDFRRFGKGVLGRGTAEIGRHPHAWNSPPIISLTGNDYACAPYLIEYSPEIIQRKVVFLTDLWRDTFECEIVSHRGGRWASMDANARILRVSRPASGRASSETPSPRRGVRAGSCSGKGNICRSPFAAEYLRKRAPAIGIDSAGCLQMPGRPSPAGASKRRRRPASTEASSVRRTEGLCGRSRRYHLCIRVRSGRLAAQLVSRFDREDFLCER